MTGSARLFIALDLPRDVREALGWWVREARREGGPMRLIDADQLHVTVCFLGTRSVTEIDAIAAAARASAAPVRGLSLGAPLWLPRRRPRLLAVEVHDPPSADTGEQALAAVRRELAEALAEVTDWEPERRAFHPHVTVARMRSERAGRAGGGRGDRALPPTPAVVFDGEALTLYRSHLHPSGATYEALASAPLRGGPPLG